MAASLLGETVHLKVTYSVFAEDASGNPTNYNFTFYDGDLTASTGTEVSGQAVSATFYSSGYPQNLTGTISFDVSASAFTSYFSGTQMPGEIKFTLTSVADESASSVNSATEAASSGFTPGVNQPLTPTFTSGGTVTGGFFPLGYQPDVNLSQTVSIGLVQTANSPPSLMGDLTATVAEGGSYVITNSDLGFSDPDDTASGVTFTVSGVTNGSVLVNGIAASSFTGTQLAAGDVSFLHNGSETTSAGFNVSVEDGNEDGSTPTVSAFNFTVTPVNDATTATGLTATLTVTEDAAVTTLFTTPPVVADPDAGDTITATLTLTGSEGTLAGAGTPVGNVYTINGSVAEVNTALAAVTFTPTADFNGTVSVDVSVSDGEQTTPADGTVTITVTAVNDAAVITGDLTNTATEDNGAIVVGALNVSDIDSPSQAAFIAQANAPATYGTFSITSDGEYGYQLDNTNTAVQALGAGETTIDTVTVTTVDGTTQNVVITITGINDAALIAGATTNTATEDQTAAVSGTLTITDVDTGEATFVAQNAVATSYGTFSVNTAGAYTYTLDNTNAAVQALGAGVTTTDVITITSADGTTQDITITITGVNDAAVIAGATTNTVTEDQTAAVTGTLTVTDVDTAEATFQARNGVATTYGSFSIDAAGNYTYTLDNTNAAVQALNAGQTIDDVIQVTSADGTNQDVTITINGVDEPPPPPPPPVTQGTAGDDNIAVGTSTTPTYGGGGSDNITATPAAGTTAQLFGGSATNDPNDGGDTISVSGAGSVVAYGNGGDDQITVTATGSASVFGGMGDDRVSVTNNADNSVVGGMGADTIAITSNGNNQVLGGSSANDPNDGADRITISGNGNNTVYANGGNDTIVITGSGSNTVYGGAGNDAITGGSGNDQIVGGQGSNVLTGGAGSDKFVFTSGGQDIITDFNFAEGDRIALNGEPYGFTQTSDGNAAILIGESGVIVLAGVSPESLSADFFA